MRDARAISPGRTALDRFLPACHFREFHSTWVPAARDAVYRALKEVTADEIFLFRTLVAIRRLGRRATPGILDPPRGEALLAVAARTGFLVLEDRPSEEIVLGTLVVSPDGPAPIAPASPLEFEAVALRSGVALAAMNFRVTDAAGGTRLTTETRVFAPDRSVRRRFALYWAVIRPGSGMIRRMWLRAVKRRALR